MLESSRVITETARAEGQNVGDLLLYPNYAMVENPVERLYGSENAERIEELRRRYDPVSIYLLDEYEGEVNERMKTDFL